MTSPTSFCSLERLISFYLQIFVLLLHTSFTMKVSPCIVDLSWAGPTCRKAAFHNQGFARHILLEHLVLSWALSSVQLLSRVQLFVTPMDCNTPDFSVHHQLPEIVQTHVYWVSGDAIQRSHALSSPSGKSLSACGLFGSDSSETRSRRKGSDISSDVNFMCPLDWAKGSPAS